MNIVTLASLAKGSGKSTLTAHLSAAARQSGYYCLLVDADLAGVLTGWTARRHASKQPVENGAEHIDRVLQNAQKAGYDWVFVDTPAAPSAAMQFAIAASTLVVIPARPCAFDLAAVRNTVQFARDWLCPYVVVPNAAPTKHGNEESTTVAHARGLLDRFGIPSWPDQISQRAAYPISLAVGGTALEIAPQSPACAEVMGLWTAVQRLVGVVNDTRREARTDVLRGANTIGVAA